MKSGYYHDVNHPLRTLIHVSPTGSRAYLLPCKWADSGFSWCAANSVKGDCEYSKISVPCIDGAEYFETFADACAFHRQWEAAGDRVIKKKADPASKAAKMAPWGYYVPLELQEEIGRGKEHVAYLYRVYNNRLYFAVGYGGNGWRGLMWNMGPKAKWDHKYERFETHADVIAAYPVMAQHWPYPPPWIPGDLER